MNPKTTIVLCVALILAVGGVWWAQSSSLESDDPARPSGPQELFDLSASDVTQFAIKSASASTCSFIKKGNEWAMTSPISGPAERSPVDADVRKIVDLKYVKTYAKDDPDAPTPDMTLLDNPTRVVKLTDKADKLYVLKIGARQKLSDKTYVQKENDDTIYLVDADLNKDLRRGLKDYRGKRVSQFTTSDAVRIQITGSHNYTLAKQDGNWTLEAPVKARSDASAVNRLLGGLANLRITDFVEDQPKSLRPYGLERPQLVVTISTEKRTPKPPPMPPASQPTAPEFEIEKAVIRVAFGGVADNKVFARLLAENSPAIFQVSESVLDVVGPPIKNLRDKTVAGVQTNRAQRIKVTSGSDSVELVKEGAKWRIVSGVDGAASDLAEYAAVDDLLKAVRDLKAVGFEDVASPAHGLDDPRAVIELFVEGQVKPLKLSVGNISPSKTSVYVRNESEAFTAVVAAEGAEALTVKPIAFLGREILTFDRGRASKLEMVCQGVGRTVRIDDGAWCFVDPVQGTVQETAVKNVLADLSNLRGRRVVARSTAAADYGLDNPAVRVIVTVEPLPKPMPTTQPSSQPADASDEQPEPPTLHTVLLSRHGDKVFAMNTQGTTICEVDAKVLTDLEAELLDTRVAILEPSAGRRLAFSTKGDSPFAFEKRGDDWSLVGESTFQVDSAKIQGVLDSLRDLRASRYERYANADTARYGLDEPADELIVDLEDGTSVALRISDHGPSDGDRYASVASEPSRVFVIKADDVKQFQKKVADFQKTK